MHIKQAPRLHVFDAIEDVLTAADTHGADYVPSARSCAICPKNVCKLQTGFAIGACPKHVTLDVWTALARHWRRERVAGVEYFELATCMNNALSFWGARFVTLLIDGGGTNRPGQSNVGTIRKRVGWEAGTRTPIRRSRICSPTIERPPIQRHCDFSKRVLTVGTDDDRWDAPAVALPQLQARP